MASCMSWLAPLKLRYSYLFGHSLPNTSSSIIVGGRIFVVSLLIWGIALSISEFVWRVKLLMCIWKVMAFGCCLTPRIYLSNGYLDMV
jgi:hypothetical protein